MLFDLNSFESEQVHATKLLLMFLHELLVVIPSVQSPHPRQLVWLPPREVLVLYLTPTSFFILGLLIIRTHRLLMSLVCVLLLLICARLYLLSILIIRLRLLCLLASVTVGIARSSCWVFERKVVVCRIQFVV